MIKQYGTYDIRKLAADYGEHGAVHLPGFLGHDELSRLQKIVDTTIDEPPTPDRLFPFQRSEGRLTMRYLWRDNADVRDVLLQRAVAKPIADIVGTRTLRFWFDLTFVHFGAAGGKEGIGTPWHHDVPTFAFRGDLMPSLWLALTPTDSTLSQLKFIAGSHRTNQGYYRSPELPKPPAGSQDGFVDLPDFDALIANGSANVLTWDCRAGDAILLHPATIHGAQGNDGNGTHPRRIAMTTRWLGDDVRFLPHSYERAIQHPAAAQTGLKLGQRPHGDWFPLVYDVATDSA